MDRRRHYHGQHKFRDNRGHNVARAAAPAFNRPEIIGYMSVDGNREYHSDLSELRFVNKLPQGPVALDLNEHIDKAIKRSTKDNVEKIDLLLRFILDKGQNLDLSEPWTVVCYRRSLLEVMCKAWPGLESRRIAATLLDGCIYLCSLQTPEQEEERNTRSDREKTMCAWGYQFEQLVTSELPNKPPVPDQPVVENAEFSLYLRTRFGAHNLVYGAQIDGVLSTSETAPPPETGGHEATLEYLRRQSYVELKTNRLIESRRQEDNFKRRKLLYCWGQCFVGALRGLVIGLRDDGGVVRDIQCLDTASIVDYCQDQWTPEEPLSFLDNFLTFVKDHFKTKLQRIASQTCQTSLHGQADPYTTLEQREQHPYDITNIGPITAQFDIMTDRDRTIVVSEGDSILPQWYVEERRKQVREFAK